MDALTVICYCGDGEHTVRLQYKTKGTKIPDKTKHPTEARSPCKKLRCIWGGGAVLARSRL